MMRLRCAMPGLLAVTMLAGCVGAPRPASVPLTPEIYTSLARYQRVYVLAAGDQLEVQVDQMPEWTRTVTIRPDGFISMPKLGEIQLGGRSVPEANAAIAAVLAKRVIAPQVTVTVQNPRDDVVFVTGEVGRSAAVPLRQAHTIAEALVVAGGATHAAALSKVAVLRLDAGGHLQAYMVSRRGPGVAGDYLTMQAMPLQSGDVIIVPERGLSKFSRFIQEAINAPLTGVNQLFTPYLQYRLTDRL